MDLISQIRFTPESSQDLKQGLGLGMAWEKLAEQGSERNGFSLASGLMFEWRSQTFTQSRQTSTHSRPTRHTVRSSRVGPAS